ncbi:MAG: FecR domain-containing protein [Pseudomonadota bacterium]
MMKSKTLSLAAMLLASTTLAAKANENIGTVSALNQDVEGTPPEAQTRELVIGDDLVSDELIESSPIGSGQFMFLDQTTLTIAKNSTIVLDKYVYNPETRTGEFAMSMQRGVLRFVGGRITKNADAVITTPTATIGIRGGMAIIIVEEDGTTRVMHIAGEYTRVTRIGEDPSLLGGGGGGDGITITRNNGVAEVSSGGEVEYVGVADRRFVRETTVALIGRGEAGERVEPQDPDVVVSGVPAENSEAKGAEREPPISTRGERSNSGLLPEEDEERFRPKEEEITGPLAEERRPELDIQPIGVLLEGVAGSASFSGATTPGVTTGPGGQTFLFDQIFAGSRIGVTADDEVFIIPTEPGFFTFGFDEGASPAGGIAGGGFFSEAAEFTYAVFQTQAGDTGAFLAGRPSAPLPDAPTGARTARSYQLSPDLFTGNGAAFTPSSQAGFSAAGQSDLTLLSNDGGGATGGDANAVATYLQINGTGAGQTSGFGVYTSDVTASDGGNPVIDGFFEGSFIDADGEIQRIETNVETIEDGAGGSAFGPGAQFLALGNGDGVGGETTPGRIVDEAGTATLFGTNNVAERTSVANVQNSADRALVGYSAIAGRDLETGDDYVALSSNTDGVLLTLNGATNSGTAVLQVNQTLANLNGGVPERADLERLVVTYGGDDDRSAVIDNDRFAMRDAADGTFTGNSFPGETRDEVQPGQSAFRGALASADLAGDGGIFPAGVTARSEFLTWGWWAGEFRGDPDSTLNLDGSPVDDQRLHLGAWVAGDLATALPFTGSASYEGFAVISAVQDGRNVVDGAGFGLSYDFGSRFGTATFTDVLGADATIGVNGTTQGDVAFQGTAGINIGGSSGLISVNGDFFDAVSASPAIISTGRVIPPDATAGSILLGTFDGRVTGSGVFAGDRLIPAAPPIR